MREPKYYTRSFLIKLFPKYCRGRLIDVGAGRAKYRWLIDPYVNEYVSVDDLSSGDQYKNEQDKKRINHVIDAASLPFGQNEFDSALCIELIEHVKDPWAVVAEIYRVLRPGGHLILASGWLSPFHEEPKDYWRFSEDGYKLLGLKAGFEFIESKQQGGMFTSIVYIITRNIELRGRPWMKKIQKKFNPVRRAVELIAEKLDERIPTPDSVGHIIVFKKS